MTLYPGGMIVYWSCMILANLLVMVAEWLNRLTTVLARWSRRLVQIALKQVQ